MFWQQCWQKYICWICHPWLVGCVSRFCWALLDTLFLDFFVVVSLFSIVFVIINYFFLILICFQIFDGCFNRLEMRRPIKTDLKCVCSEVTVEIEWHFLSIFPKIVIQNISDTHNFEAGSFEVGSFVAKNTHNFVVCVDVPFSVGDVDCFSEGGIVTCLFVFVSNYLESFERFFMFVEHIFQKKFTIIFQQKMCWNVWVKTVTNVEKQFQKNSIFKHSLSTHTFQASQKKSPCCKLSCKSTHLNPCTICKCLHTCVFVHIAIIGGPGLCLANNFAVLPVSVTHTINAQSAFLAQSTAAEATASVVETLPIWSLDLWIFCPSTGFEPATNRSGGSRVTTTLQPMLDFPIPSRTAGRPQQDACVKQLLYMHELARRRFRKPHYQF